MLGFLFGDGKQVVVLVLVEEGLVDTVEKYRGDAFIES